MGVITKSKSRWIIPVVLLALVLTSCGLPTGNERPDDSKLRDGVKLLMTQFEAKHPKLINWDFAKVSAQINRPFPLGVATEAGWSVKWPNYAPGEFPQVVIPWTILGQYPTKYKQDVNNYSGGSPVPSVIAVQISRLQQGVDDYFAAIVNTRFSKVDRTWIIFTSIPYLPVTDPAFGWAHFANNKWVISDFGTATVGCGITPAAVQQEFGFTCPSK